MRQLKLLLAAIALLWAMPCWGKPIDLHGKWAHPYTAKKSALAISISQGLTYNIRIIL